MGSSSWFEYDPVREGLWPIPSKTLDALTSDVLTIIDLHSPTASTEDQTPWFQKIRGFVQQEKKKKTWFASDKERKIFFSRKLFNMISDKRSDLFQALQFYSYFPDMFFWVAEKAIRDKSYSKAFAAYVPPDHRNILDNCGATLNEATTPRDFLGNAKGSGLDANANPIKISTLLGPHRESQYAKGKIDSHKEDYEKSLSADEKSKYLAQKAQVYYRTETARATPFKTIDVLTILDLHSPNMTKDQTKVQELKKIRDFLQKTNELNIPHRVLVDIFNMISDNKSDLFIALTFYSYFPDVFFWVAEKAIHDNKYFKAFAAYLPPDHHLTLDSCVETLNEETIPRDSKGDATGPGLNVNARDIRISSLLGFSLRIEVQYAKDKIDTHKAGYEQFLSPEKKREYRAQGKQVYYRAKTGKSFLQKRQVSVPNFLSETFLQQPTPDFSSPKLLTQQTTPNSLSPILLHQSQQTEQTGHAVMSLYMLLACAVFFFVLMKLRK